MQGLMVGREHSLAYTQIQSIPTLSNFRGAGNIAGSNPVSRRCCQVWQESLRASAQGDDIFAAKSSDAFALLLDNAWRAPNASAAGRQSSP